MLTASVMLMHSSEVVMAEQSWNSALSGRGPAPPCLKVCLSESSPVFCSGFIQSKELLYRIFIHDNLSSQPDTANKLVHQKHADNVQDEML